MKQVKIVPFEAGHLLSLEIQEEQQAIFDLMPTPSDAIDYGNMLIDNSVITIDNKKCAWTALVGNKVIGCGGIVQTLQTSGECWLLLSKDFRKYAAHIVPEIRKQAHNTNLLRICAFADKGFTRAERFLEALGFEHEATLEKSGLNGVDQEVYKIIKENK